MKLTDNEKRDIIKHIEAGRPLPDAYRFLLFDDKREVELVWNGKTADVCNVTLPFQIIEQVDEPRTEAALTEQGSIFDAHTGRQARGWANKLIWGDNKLILSSLKNGPMRDELEKQGGIKLIYIDPPFDVGADFSMNIDIGADRFTKQPTVLEELAYRDTWGRGQDSFIAMIYERLVLMRDLLAEDGSINGPMRDELEKQGGIKLIYIDPPFDVGADFSMNIDIGADRFTKQPTVLEELAYRDTWGRGQDSFIAMIYERLVLMRDLLAEDGSIYVHCDWRVNSLLRLVLDEIFGVDNFINEIAWEKIKSVKSQTAGFGNVKDSIYFYTKGNLQFNQQRIPHNEKYIRSMYRHVDEDGRRYRLHDFTQTGQGGSKDFGKPWGFLAPPSGKHWIWPQEKITQGIMKGDIVFSKNGIPSVKRYLDEVKGQAVGDMWVDINPIGSISKERNNYPTQKPEALLERIIKASSSEGDLVADFFCGSGTTAAVAEKLGRKWIATDLGKFAIHTTRKRMIGIQRRLKADNKPWRAFEILNLGKYERQHYIGVNPNLRAEEKQRQLQEKEAAYIRLILHAYRAEPVTGFSSFHGKRGGRMVTVGPVNLPVSRLLVDEVINECQRQRVTRADILGFEFEMGLFPNMQEAAKDKGIELAMKYIPRQVFDKQAVERGQVVFYDMAFIEVRIIVEANTLAVKLTGFSVSHTQDKVNAVEAALRNGKSKIAVEAGDIIKVAKDKQGKLSHERLNRHWSDWIDYWAVDYDFESRREMIRVPVLDESGAPSGESTLQWSGDYVFENEWQSFRTRQNRTLELMSRAQACPPGPRKVAIKVVDILGNDTMKVVGVKI